MKPDSPIRSRSWDGRMRDLYVTKCQFCFEWYYVPKKELDKTKYCSKPCAGRAKRKRVTVTCSFCSREIFPGR